MRNLTITSFLLIMTLVMHVGAEPIPPFRGIVTSRALAIHAPRPEYPLSVRKRRLGGQGEFIMHINRKTGIVRSVEIAKSTGVARLDQSCIDAFQRWTFIPGTVSKVRCPIKFTPPQKPAPAQR
jgi:TonB family protein